MSWSKNLFVGSTKDPEKLYKHAVKLFAQQKFRDAAAVLEETVKLNPSSAPVHFTLGATYNKIAVEYVNDEEKVLPWMKKSRDCFKKAIDLAAISGGLNEEQLSTARDAVTMFDHVITEEQRKNIFADFMETLDTEFLLDTNVDQEMEAASANVDLAGLIQGLNQGAARADTATYAKIGKKYKLSEGRLRAIVEEGKKKKWSFQGVAR